MRKFTQLDSLDRPSRPKSKAPLYILVVIVLISTPPLFELGKMNLARWGVLGFTSRVDTPILDFLSKRWESNHSELRDWITPMTVNRRWNPTFVIPIACAWTALAALMLRRGH